MDNEKPTQTSAPGQVSHPDRPSDRIENAHASGDGTLERSEASLDPVSPYDDHRSGRQEPGPY